MTIIIKYLFSIYDGRYLSVAVPWESYPLPEMYGFRVPTPTVYPSYDVKNKYMGYMDNGILHEMRDGWYCTICDFEKKSFWKAVIHNIKHLYCVRKRKTAYVSLQEFAGNNKRT